MKHTGLACLAAFAVSVLAALPFAVRAQDNAAEVFDKTTSRLEKGGISYSFTNGEAAGMMVDKMFDSFDVLAKDNAAAQGILQLVRSTIDDLGFKAVLGCGTSVRQNGDFYRIVDFLYAPQDQRKGLFWDLIGANTVSKGAAPELKLASPKSAIAISFRLEPGAVYAYVDKKLRENLDEETMAEIDQQISDLNNSGIQPDKLLECISGVTFYIEPIDKSEIEAIMAEEADEDETAEEDVQEKIAKVVPKFAFVFTTKSDLCWKALANFVSQSNPDILKDDKIVPAEGFAIFQAGNYLIATNEEAAVRDRIAGKGADLTSNAAFAKMYSLVDKDFSNFAWVSEDYFKSISDFIELMQSASGESAAALDPAAFFGGEIHNALSTIQFNADGILANSITSDLQIALLGSDTVPGLVAGILPYAGPFVKFAMEAADKDDDDSLELAGRLFVANLALSQLEDAAIPSDSPCVFFTLGEDGPVFVKWDAAKEEFVHIPAESEEEEFPYLIIASPADAAKADKPEETVVFYEDPMEFSDGIFVMFADGAAKFLEGNFDTHTEAMDAAINTFDISEDIGKELLKKAAAVDKIFE